MNATLDKVLPKIDLVFLIDATSSDAMRSVIAALPDMIEKMVMAVQETRHVDFRFRVIGYRDRDVDGENWLVDNPFVIHIEHLVAQFATLESYGGGDEPESLLDAMYVVSQWPTAAKDVEPTWGEWRHRLDGRRALAIITDSGCKPTFTAQDGSVGGVGDIIGMYTSERISVYLVAPECPQYEDLSCMDQMEWEPISPIERASVVLREWVADERALARWVRTLFSARAIPLDPELVFQATLARYQQELAQAEQQAGLIDPSLCQFLLGLSDLLKAHGDNAASESFCERALAIQQQELALCEKRLGPNHLELIPMLHDLESLLESHGDHVASKKASLQVLAIRQHDLQLCEQQIGKNSPGLIPQLRSLGALLKVHGDLARAEICYRRILAIQQQELGPEHPDIVNSLEDLASIVKEMGDFVAVEPLHRQLLAINEKTYGLVHPFTRMALSNLELILETLGNLEAAETICQRFLSANEMLFGSDNADTAQARERLASLYDKMGRPNDAAKMRFPLSEGEHDKQ